MKLPTGTAESGKDYEIQLGQEDSFDHLGIMPPPSTISINALRGIIESNKDTVITDTGVRYTTEKKPYYEIISTKMDRLDLFTVGHAAIAVIEAQNGKAFLEIDVQSLSGSQELFQPGRKSFNLSKDVDIP